MRNLDGMQVPIAPGAEIGWRVSFGKAAHQRARQQIIPVRDTLRKPARRLMLEQIFECGSLPFPLIEQSDFFRTNLVLAMIMRGDLWNKQSRPDLVAERQNDRGGR